MRFILKFIVRITIIVFLASVLLEMVNRVPIIATSALTDIAKHNNAMVSASRNHIPTLTELVTGQTYAPAPPMQQVITTPNLPNQNYIEYRGQRTEINVPVKSHLAENAVNNSMQSTKIVKNMSVQRSDEENRKKAIAIVEKARRDGQYSNR